MHRIFIPCLIAAAMPLAACGGADAGEGTSPARFEGARFAPSQEVMNTATGEAMIYQKGGGYMLKEPGSRTNSNPDCSKIGDRGDDFGSCAGRFQALVATTVFEPQKCWKGDERRYTDTPVNNAVTCLGQTDSSRGSANIKITFSETLDGQPIGDISAIDGWTER